MMENNRLEKKSDTPYNYHFNKTIDPDEPKDVDELITF